MRNPPLYPSLWAVCEFVKYLDEATLSDADDRRRAAIARYVAELPLNEYIRIRRNWRRAAA